jgi:hypothetical protein
VPSTKIITTLKAEVKKLAANPPTLKSSLVYKVRGSPKDSSRRDRR